MKFFQLKKNEMLAQIKENTFKLEKEIQYLTEKNIKDIFGLKLIKSEFALDHFRFDTLAYDDETKSFVIIEYKRNKSFSVIDQGYAYLSSMLDHKSDFILEYNEAQKKTLQRKAVDWSQSKVIFVSTSFNAYQKEAINFKDLPIELWEIRRYSNGMVSYSRINTVGSKASINTITAQDETIRKVGREVKKYSIDDQFKDDWKNSRDIFEVLSERILNIDSRLDMIPRKSYIGYRIGSRNMVYLHIYKSKVMVVFARTEPKDLKDPEKKVQYSKDSYKYYNQHLSTFDLKNLDDIDYAIFLTKQVHNRHFK